LVHRFVDALHERARRTRREGVDEHDEGPCIGGNDSFRDGQRQVTDLALS
jgi:hypothetical protein